MVQGDNCGPGRRIAQARIQPSQKLGTHLARRIAGNNAVATNDPYSVVFKYELQEITRGGQRPGGAEYRPKGISVIMIARNKRQGRR